MSMGGEVQPLTIEQKRAKLAEALRRKEQAFIEAPLSYSQQRLWFVDQIQPGNPIYNINVTVRITGELRRDRFEPLMQQVVERHESLRTTFVVRDGVPWQHIAARVRPNIEYLDHSELPGDSLDEMLTRFARAHALTEFDLAQGPLSRISIIQISETKHVGCFTTHHIISDGWSIGVMLFELAALYAVATGRSSQALPPLKIQYRDFAKWQRERLDGEVAQRMQGFWTDYLRDAPQILDIPTDQPRPAHVTQSGTIHRFRLPPELCDELKAYSRRQQTTIFNVLFSGFATLLYRISDQPEMLIGVPVNGRDRAEIQTLIGYFVNIIPVRVNLAGNPSFEDLVRRVRDSLLAAQANQEVPFDKLVEALQPKRTPGRIPLVQVVYLHQSFPLPDPQISPGLHFAQIEVHPGFSRFELALRTEPDAHGIAAILEYNTDLFDATTVSRWADQFVKLMHEVAADPSITLNQISILTEEDHRRLNRLVALRTSESVVTAHQLRRAAVEFVSPRTDVERQIAAIWSRLLDITQVGIHDDFFELGGNSLLAMQLVNELRAQLGIDVDLRRLFTKPTIATVAQMLAPPADDVAEFRQTRIQPAPADAPLLLSSSQQLLYLLEQFDQELAFNAALAIDINGPLDQIALQRGLDDLVRRHSILRASIQFLGGHPVHRLQPAMSVPLTVRDFSDGSLDARRLAITWAEELTRQRFDLSAGPLVRFGLAKLAADSHVLLIAIHHMVSDGWSFAILYQDLVKLYEAHVHAVDNPLPELPIQFVDYAYWQRTAPALEYDRGAQYWKERFLGDLPTLDLPLDYPRSKSIAAEPGVCELSIPPDIAVRLRAISRSEGATLYMTLMSAYMILLHKLTQQTDVIVGSSAANRLHAETTGLIGFFAGLLPLRCDLSGDPSFVGILQRVRTLCVDAFSHPEPRLDDMIEAFRPPSPGMMPLCQTLFTYWDFATQSNSSGGVTWSLADLNVVRVSGYDLVLAIRPNGEALSGAILYRTDLFRPQTVEKFRDYFELVLRRIVDNPNYRLSQLQLLSDKDRQQILNGWNDTQAPYPADKCLHELFEAQAAVSPDAPAIRTAQGDWTYSELNQFANQVASSLIERHVKRDSIVAVLLEKGPELVGAILGVLKAGGAYLPIDSSWPSRRIRNLLDVSRPAVLIKSMNTWSDGAVANNEPENGDSPDSPGSPGSPDNETNDQLVTLDIDSLAKSDESFASNERANGAIPSSLAYVIFTSGSSGIPKGVMIEHRSVVNVVASFIHAYRLSPSDRVLQQASIAFDVSVNEIFPVLCAGGVLVIPAEDQVGDFDQLSELIQQNLVTIMGATPSGLTELNRRVDRLYSLRLVLSGGEALARSHIDQLQQFATVTNGYGPTETTVCATYFDLRNREETGGEWIPIGKPLPNYKVYVLDKDLQPVPIGLPGELCISGVGVARGYLSDAQLTSEKFVPNPFVRGERLYRTGDEVRWRSDGNLEFVGRLDRQIKIRGQRIELGEIEAVLAGHPDVIRCAVVCNRTATGEPRVGAFAKVLPGSSLVDSWREYLRQRLPQAMIPVAFVPLDEIPLTHNGKVDYAKLPQLPDVSALVRGEYVAPRNADEELMASIWSNALGLERIGVTESFFDLGGHSLLAAQILFRVEREFKVRLSYRAFFDSQTIAQTVEVLARQRELQSADMPTIDIELQSTTAPTAVSPLRHWFSGQTDISAANKIDFHAEVWLDETIQAGSKPRVDVSQVPSTILLTGATGFLGAFLLREFASWHQIKIHCLIRADSEREAMERLRKGLRKYRLDDEAIFDRIVPVLGDLAKPNLGLNESGFLRLAENIDWIYHNGAAVNFVYPYSALKAANVNGTRDVLRLAATTRIKPVHFSSTLAVLVGDQIQQGVIRESDHYEFPERMNSGYGQSKWVAEQLVRLAGQRGIPVAIYRPGRITGDSVTGAWNADDLFLAGLNFLLQAGAAPDLDIQQDLTPVDYVARWMKEISSKPACLGKTFHVVNPQLVAWPNLVRGLQQAGYELNLVQFEQWKQEFIATFGEFPEDWMSWLIPRGTAAVQGSVAESVARVKISYDCSEVQSLMASSSAVNFPSESELLQTYLRGLVQASLLPPPSPAQHG